MRARCRRWWSLGAALAVALGGWATPAAAGEVDPPIEGTVLVVAPHPDDDVIMAAGITYDRPDTIIAFMTNGDSHTDFVTGTASAGTTQWRIVDASATFLSDGLHPGVEVTVTNEGSATIASVDSETELTLDVAIPGLDPGDEYTTEYFIPTGIAETRQAEAVAAQQILGRVESELVFLGYPDYHLTEVWTTDPPAVVTGATGKTETYASRGLGGTDWHDYRTGGVGEHAPYHREALLADVVALIATYRPDHVFTTAPEDGTADHRTTYEVVKAAMEAVHAADPTYVAALHRSVVWQNPADPLLNERWPTLWDGTGPPEPHDPPPDAAERAALGIGGEFAPAWDTRDVHHVPAALLDPDPNTNPKYRAIAAHASQGGMANTAYIARFFHADEFSWPEAIPGSPTAVADAYGSVPHGGTTNVDGVLDNDVGLELRAELVTGPSHGTLSLQPDGSFTYTHDGSATTSDAFTYRAVDRYGASATALVSLTIDAPPPPPPAPPPHRVGLVDPAQGKWYLYDANGVLVSSFYFGNPGDYPIYGDWDCDGVETPGLY
ncbi:MAG TPA: hypothetical protein ENK55_10355, partial [Actinobacteria bacterium]|nr:hypothetical protein [Actinomycetota bacterium]